MKKIRLTESDLVRIIEKVVKEELGGMDDAHPIFGKMNFKKDMDKTRFKKYRKNPFDNEMENEFEFEDDFEFEDSELAEMKRKVRVMENKLRRRKQMRRRR